MVMGIFMCVFLVGALWYIAGIGDAIIFRERLQEASDAVAFSTAVLEARGMNILVLMNLLMAAILSLLVAINIVIAVTVAFSILMAAIGAGLLAGVFTAEAAPPFFAASYAADDVYNGFEQPLHDTVSPLVDEALRALHTAEQAIPAATPKAAQAASIEIIQDYAPLLSVADAAGLFVGGTTPLFATSLPVKDGTTHKLCMKAFDAVKGAIGAVTGGIGSDLVVGPVEGLANLVGESDFFCELGGGGSSPDMSKNLNSLGADRCASSSDITTTCNQADADERSASALQTTCAGWVGPAPPDPPDPQCPNLDAIQANADAEEQTCADKRSKCQDSVNQGAGKAPPSSSLPPQGSGSGKEPAAVDDSKFWNGSASSQILAMQYGDGKFVNYSPRFVKFASRGEVDMRDPSSVQRTSVSQAEFFYDVPGTWDAIDADQDAMWNFHWRARFRLVNPAVFGVVYGLEAPMVNRLRIDASHTTLSSLKSPARVQLLFDLTTLFPPMSMTLH